MSDYHSIEPADTLRAFSLVKRADGAPITTGTVNYYLKAKSGANSGKWHRESDQSWQAGETANAMAHEADGHWTISLNAAAFAGGVLYVEYAKESADLHIPVCRLLKCEYTPAADGSRRVTLAANGLDAISAAAPTAVAADFREMVVQLWRRFFKKSLMDTSGGVTTLKTYADDGSTVVTTQTLSESASQQEQGAAE